MIDSYNYDLLALRKDLIKANAGYGEKKTDMVLRDMVVLGIWDKDKVRNFDKLNVASDVNTIKVALRTGIISTAIPLVSSFLDIFCYQYSYMDAQNAQAWRRVWEIWRQKYPQDEIGSPCLLDFLCIMLLVDSSARLTCINTSVKLENILSIGILVKIEHAKPVIKIID